MPISRVRSITAAYIAWKMTMKPMIIAIPITTRITVVSPGTLLEVIRLRYSFSECTPYCCHAGNVLDFLHHLVGVVGIVELDVEDRGLTLWLR